MTVAAVIDHQAQALERVATQYSEAAKFLAYIRALMSQSAEIEALFGNVAEIADIDLAEGVNLDIIGEIVGVGRIIPNAIAVQFFGFDAQPGATPFGEEGTPGIGARFREDAESESATSVLSDIEYRMLIRAKIVKNHALGTCEDILAALSYLFGGVPSNVDDIGVMHIGVAIGAALTYRQKALINQLDILPRPAGVNITQRVSYDANNYFGFDGQPGAKVFGEEGLPGGGLLAEEF